jgi:predicted ribosome quality control (RQC) complex YloA/Tae2 family protein
VAAKREGALGRVGVLKAEIAQLEASVFSPAPAPKRAGNILQKTNAKGRTLVLDGGATAFIGKSAADNLALLRKARAWDYWMHLRDEPGAHAIVHRERNQSISDDEFRKVARWLAKESSASKKGMSGVFVVVMTECRFVRPIKGDRLGRVNYHHGREISVSP